LAKCSFARLGCGEVSWFVAVHGRRGRLERQGALLTTVGSGWESGDELAGAPHALSSPGKTRNSK
jgi:hypothetical protein